GICCQRGDVVVNGKCCPREWAAHGRCDPPQNCPPGQIKLPNGVCCDPQFVRQGRCVPPPVVSVCPSGQVLLPNGVCCPPQAGNNGVCSVRPSHVDRIRGCLNGQVRLTNGRCGHPPTIVRIPGRLHVDKPPKHDKPKRERSIKPNWKPQLHTAGNVRLNTFRSVPMGGG